MDANSKPIDGSLASHGGEERRRHPRIYEPFPVTVRAVDANGAAFTLDTVLDNFAAGGFYLRLARLLDPGARVFGVVRLSTVLTPGVSVPRVAVRGRVVRVEPLPGSVWGVAVAFTRNRFL